jgi:hypothetical protein
MDMPPNYHEAVDDDDMLSSIFIGKLAFNNLL